MFWTVTHTCREIGRVEQIKLITFKMVTCPNYLDVDMMDGCSKCFKWAWNTTNH
ncbi:hypothetical protein NC652_025285 [Populus alba x Populus x berolinensis]|uniref:Uncharacterized protein n=1 Tax=Populus alba x Populus x berolinensis TaxID=444605 RepID=A0AAD6Q7E3_9ROSI|nr:hypothetical protein NC652_025284 [Populus alba x Populus x berolinensis]KAJ6898713.1 hypothetical protein NC652_025285 [Populus alba x Populus x berolinensis]KAJ6981637.1 hypothetical protein NC653_024897 [Populus alba x Populus x berolinensis]KAJ6981642.1 hypothetical protein NC653_024902 [Populus alba x Populus x berolinensis]